MTWLFLLLILSAQAVMRQEDLSAQPKRVPLTKPIITLESPAKYEKRIIGTDPRTGQLLYYDPKPRVLLLDGKSKKYGLRWIGYDGNEKTVMYQRPDAIDVVVSASVSKVAGGQFLYVYVIANLTSSMEHLSMFAVQNYSSEVIPIKSPSLYVGGITKNGREFKDGNWIGFGILARDLSPGRHLEVKLLSSAPPGLVECRAAGVLGMKGVGEEMPQELENVLPGYEAWPHGYTLGPIYKLQSYSKAERANYIASLLPQIRKLGWMTALAFRWYQQNLQRRDFEQVRKHAELDLRDGSITPEVYGMIQAIQ